MIKIPFLPEWKDLLLTGRKTHTCRSRRYGTPGDQFEAFGEVFELVSVKKKTLEDVRDNYWHQEGCNSPAEFVEVWDRIHPTRGFVGSDVRWLHEFRLARAFPGVKVRVE